MLRALVAFVFSAALLAAAVTKVEISERSDLPVAGAERIGGKIYFALDPKNPANRGIVDLDRAPRNPQGLVEFSADLRILQPRDPARRNGTMILEVANRGRSALLRLGFAGRLNPMRTAKDIGDPWLLELGFTLAWVGWEFDLPPEAESIRLLDAPVIRGITGPVRAQIRVDQKTTSSSLADRNMVAYVVAEPSSGRMTVRDGFDGGRIEIPRTDWHFTADGQSVEYPKGFEPGRIYEVVYTGKDPIVTGVGSAALRDYVAYTRERGQVKYAIAYGQSQTGSFLRGFVRNGFNGDEKGRKVFVGIWAHIGGSGLQGQVRFGQPSRSRWDYPTDLPPFTPEGLLAKSRAAGVAPKLFLSNNSHEYWNSAGSLVHTSTDGKSEIPPPADTRIYYIAGTQHESADGPPTVAVQYPGNDLQLPWVMHGLLIAMSEWVTEGTEPPPSRYPSLARGELVDLPALKFPKVPEVRLPAKVYRPRVLDFGPDFASKGIISIEPPKAGVSYTALVPQVDADGNEIAGIHLPQLSVPLGTYTGWNLRQPKIGAPDATYNQIGSTFPFALTRAERNASGDPRPSIGERYKDEKDFLTRTEAAARELVKQRYVLDRDMQSIVDLARERWHTLMSHGPAQK